VCKTSHDETSLVSKKWVSLPTRHLIKLSLCEAANKGDEQVWCREVIASNTPSTQTPTHKFLAFSVIEKMQGWMEGVG
jgi:hypothetical protein